MDLALRSKAGVDNQFHSLAAVDQSQQFIKV